MPESTIPFWFLICLAITLGYLFFAVKASAGEAPDANGRGATAAAPPQSFEG